VACGYAGVLSIALTPVVALPLASHWTGEWYPVHQACGFFWLWAGCGALFYGYTFLLAQMLEGEYTAILVAIPSLMLYGVLAELPWLARFPMLNVFDVMNGEDMPFFDERNRMLIGSLPWLAIAGMMATAAVLVYAAARRMEPRDF
jgi:hypothetical protein